MPELWFRALTLSLPVGVVTPDQLMYIRQTFTKDEKARYKALKALIVSTYVNNNAHVRAREELVGMTMDVDKGVREFAQRLMAAWSVC